jgi:hypothetical protein
LYHGEVAHRAQPKPLHLSFEEWAPELFLLQTDHFAAPPLLVDDFEVHMHPVLPG